MNLEEAFRRVWLRYYALCHSKRCIETITDRVFFVEVNKVLRAHGEEPLKYNQHSINRLRRIVLANNERVQTLIFAPVELVKIRDVTNLKYKVLFVHPGDVKVPFVCEPAPISHFRTMMEIYGKARAKELINKWIETGHMIPFLKRCDAYYPKGKYFFFRRIPVHPARRYLGIPELAHHIRKYMSTQSILTADLCYKQYSRNRAMWYIALKLAGLIYKEMKQWGLVEVERRHGIPFIKYGYTPYIVTHFFTVAALPMHPGKKKVRIVEEYTGVNNWAVDMTWYAPSKSGKKDYLYEYEIVFWIPSPPRYASKPCWAEFWANILLERKWNITVDEFYEWHDAEIRLVKTRAEKIGYYEYRSSAGTQIGEIVIDRRDLDEAKRRCRK